ncbi:MAG: FAD-dependent oxidoreductase [Aquipseudomonas alcaligenes]|uniref:FAD-dependent oxidoreductase n=1 Tax=Aquipseudomonas alcaligenes TaxID=43263 RepID=A0A5C7WF14_AQUAC|nr:MAG: FAD-dependent oxidoreductase [Pseudomonas alcaligenes]
MLSALRLLQAGQQVTLIERTRVGHEASWAGGGIVSPLYPWRYSPAVTALSEFSQHVYPVLANELLAATGIDPEVHETGLYWLDLEDEALALEWAAREGKPLQEVDIAEVASRVGALGPGYARALWMPRVANVRNPRLVKSLRAALLAIPGFSLLEDAELVRLDALSSGGFRLALSSGSLVADRVVIAAGSWSGQLLGELGLDLPVEPVKGQMILYKCAEDFLPAMVLAKGRYAIPRKDGHILVGSTLEHAGFDKTPTGEALASLKASAEELLPGLADAEVVGHWAGLRPGSPEGIPFVGEVPEYPGLWLNCGHYRNGLVLAPASCELLKNLMLGEKPIVDPAPYATAGRLGRLPG